MDSQPLAVGGDQTRKLQALRREMNEQLRRLGHRDGEAGPLRLLCECGRCNDQVALTGESYEQAGATGRPLLKPGHESGTRHDERVEAESAWTVSRESA